MSGSVHELEQKWRIALPESFHRLYEIAERPAAGPCEFLTIDGMLADEERWFGMLPQYLPIADDGGDNLLGFYVHGNPVRDDYPVLFWDHEYDHYLPVASGFRCFLGWCHMQGVYLEDEGDERLRSQVAPEALSRVIGGQMPAAEAPPRNERELYERIAAWDPQSPQALCRLGSVFLGRGELGRARDFFARASESAPWFADPYYVLGETYRLEDRITEALDRWWRVVQCPIALSTRTGSYDLGEDQPDVEIHEAAVEALIAYCDLAPPELRATPLGRLLLEGDPFEPAERLEAAEQLAAAGDLPGEEREALNALTLATEDADARAAYARLIALYERTGRIREAELCRADSLL